MRWRDFGLGLGVGLIICVILASSLGAIQPKEVTITQTATEKITVTDKTTIHESVTITKPETTTLTRTVKETTTRTITTTSVTTTSPTTTTTTTTTATTTTQAIQEYELGEAIKSGYVEAKISGRCNPYFGCGGLIGGGVSSGDSITIQLKGLVSYTIKIFVLKGQLLLAGGDTQNMVIKGLRGIPSGSLFITPVSQIILSPYETKTYLFSAYCVNFYKSNPTNYTVFSLSGLATPEVVNVLEFVETLPSNVTSVAAIQVAIFVITDDVSKDELDERFSVEAEDIINAKTILEAAGIDISQKRLFT
jgi:hypothetical protein